MKISLFIVSMIMGCAGKKTIFPQLDFETSNSPCVDALSINQAAAGCLQVLSISADGKVFIVTCETYKEDADPTNIWLIGEFLIISKPVSPDPYFKYNAKPICEDSYVSLLVAPRRPTTK